MQVIKRVDKNIVIIAIEFQQNKPKMPSATSHLVKLTWILFMQSLMFA